VTVNEGAVFGLGQGKRVVFAVVSVAAIGFLTYLFATSGPRRFYQFVLGMLLAGVLGNLYDRMVYKYVRDMLYALPGRTWPGSDREIFPWIFNVADTLLCVGVGLMVVYSFFAPEPDDADVAPKNGPQPEPARP
jgi:signal peptidase II